MLLTKNYKDSTTLEITDITIVSTQIVRGSVSDCCCFDQYNNLSIYASTSNKSTSYFKILKAVGDTSTTTMFDVLKYHTKCCTLNRLVVCNVNQSKYGDFISYSTLNVLNTNSIAVKINKSYK
jgi:hypothetical protein